jgi:hypothetical protein
MSPLNRPKANDARATPGGVQSPARGKAALQMAIGVKHVDKPVALASQVVVLCRVLLGVGHEQVAVDVLDPERRIAGWDIGIGKVSVGGYRDIKAGGATGAYASTVPARKLVTKSKTKSVPPLTLTPFALTPVTRPL